MHGRFNAGSASNSVSCSQATLKEIEAEAKAKSRRPDRRQRKQ